MLMVAGVWSGRGDSPTALKDIYGCEEFEKDELIEMEAIIYQQRERALEDTYDKYAKASTAEEAN